MWKVVVFLDDEVAAVPCSWLIETLGTLMCFWPVKNARTKRAKDENPPSSGNDEYLLHECRVLMNGEVFYTFKEALAMEIKAQDVSTFIKSIDEESEDDTNESKKQKLSDENEEFEFIKAKPDEIEDVEMNETLTTHAANKPENELKSLQPSSLILNNDVFDKLVSVNNVSNLIEDNQANTLKKDTLGKNEVPEKINVIIVPTDVTKHNNDSITLGVVEEIKSSSDSEKIKTILLNQEAEKKVYTELVNRMDRIEKHIKKYGGGSFSKVVEELPLQVSSVEMFSKLEEDLLDATETALVNHFNKTIFEKDIKQFVKILLNRFFDNQFFAHNVTGKSGGKVVLNKTRTLGCIYDCIEKKFNKKKHDVEDTVFRAIDQLKDSLRKKFPKLPSDRKKKRNQTQKESEEKSSAEDKDKENEAAEEIAINEKE